MQDQYGNSIGPAWSGVGGSRAPIWIRRGRSSDPRPVVVAARSPGEAIDIYIKDAIALPTFRQHHR